MKLRATLLVLLLIGAVAALAIWKLGKPPAPPSARVPLVPPELLASWEEIDLDLLSDQGCRLVREPGAIMIVFGSDAQGHRLLYRDPASRETVEKLLGALRDSWREPLQGSSEDLMRAGLDPPRFHLTLRGGGQECALGFGNDDPAGQGVLARSFTDSTVFRTGKQVPNLLEFNLADWRSRTVFPTDAAAVTRIDLTKFPEKGEEGEPATLSLVRESARGWRITEPRSLAADANACLALAQAVSLLRVNNYIAQKFTDMNRDGTHLPDHPSWNLQVSAGAALYELDVGAFLPGQGYACLMPQRGEETLFAVAKDALDPILATSVDSLRPRRFFPRVESRLVALACVRPDGVALWSAEREGRSTRGSWRFTEPFAARANEGKGESSFAQVVVDVDRVEVKEFLPAETPFEPEARIVLLYSEGAVALERSLEFARDPANARTLVRDPQQPGELFAVDAKLGALAGLDPQLHRDRAIFPPPKEFQLKVSRWKAESRGREYEVVRDGAATKAVGSTPTSMEPLLTSATTELFGRQCNGYVRAATVLAAPGAQDPFAVAPALVLTLGTRDGADESLETLIVSGAPDSSQPADGGIYCKLLPRLPDDVWIIVPRPALEPLLRLFER
jgi:hypothetical protein